MATLTVYATVTAIVTAPKPDPLSPTESLMSLAKRRLAVAAVSLIVAVAARYGVNVPPEVAETLVDVLLVAAPLVGGWFVDRALRRRRAVPPATATDCQAGPPAANDGTAQTV